MRAIVIAIAIALPAFAGCVNLDEIASAIEPASGVGATLPWGIGECSAAIAIVPVPAERIAAHLPEGFRALTPEEAGLPADPRGDATFAIEAFSCASVVGANGTIADAAYGSFFTFVEPPENLRDPDATYHFVKWDTLVADPALRAALEAAGLPVHDGASAFTVVGNAAGSHPSPIQASLTMAEAVYGFNGAAGQPFDGAATGSFVEFTPTPNGVATWTADFEFGSLVAGGGYLKVPPEGFAMDVIGAERAPAYILYGSVVAFDGLVTLPSGAMG